MSFAASGCRLCITGRVQRWRRTRLLPRSAPRLCRSATSPVRVSRRSRGSRAWGRTARTTWRATFASGCGIRRHRAGASSWAGRGTSPITCSACRTHCRRRTGRWPMASGACASKRRRGPARRCCRRSMCRQRIIAARVRCPTKCSRCLQSSLPYPRGAVRRSRRATRRRAARSGSA